jgi:hypothetical protein
MKTVDCFGRGHPRAGRSFPRRKDKFVTDSAVTDQEEDALRESHP